VPNNDTYKDYVRYAEHYLNMVAKTADQESRRIQREMAAEWLRLTDAIRPPSKSWKLRPLKSNGADPGPVYPLRNDSQSRINS
jgi:hypothetical protein